MRFFTSALAASFLADVFAHPGEDMAAEMAERAAFTKFSKKDLSHCAEKFKARGIEERAVARRAATVQKARQKRGIAVDAPSLRVRDDPLTTNHESPIDYNSDTSSDLLFSSNGSCILSPEVTEGPYWIEGEYVREDNRDGQEGVELILDSQVVDVTNCEPVTNAVIEIWACNATGVYSGIVARGNGVGFADPSNLDKTFMRGLQPTDEEGVAEFTTLFPGHYSGRATHFHVMVHFNGTTFENGTYRGGYVSHVGQFYFDQSLITKVELNAPYTSNTQVLTTNAQDSILRTESANGHDPVVAYSLLSANNDVSEGIFAWISFGVDLTTQKRLVGAATLTANGGVASDGSTFRTPSATGGAAGTTSGSGSPTGGAQPAGMSSRTTVLSTGFVVLLALFLLV